MEDNTRHEELVEKLSERTLWVTSWTLVHLQHLKDLGLIQGGYDVSPELEPAVVEAREKHGHEDPTKDEIDMAMYAINRPNPDDVSLENKGW